MADAQELEGQFLEAYNANADAIFRYCYFKLSSREHAQDALQEIFMRFWKYICGGLEVRNVRAFLFTTAANYVKDQWKKKKAIPLSILDSTDEEQEHSFDPPDPESDVAVSAAEYQLALRSFARLSESDRTLLQMRFVEDMAIKDIAAALRERENTVAVRISRALAHLRKHAP